MIKLLNPKQVASLLNVQVTWIHQHSFLGDLPFPTIRIGRQLRFAESDILAFIDRQRSHSDSNTAQSSSKSFSSAWHATVHYLANNPAATQTDIAKHFSITQGAVSKHFKKARDSGYLDSRNMPTELFLKSYSP